MSSLLRILGALGAGLAIACGVHAAPFAFITNCGSNDVSVIDIATDRVVATVPVGACPYGVAVSPGGAHVYVTNRDDASLSVIDGTTFRERARIPVGTRPTGVAVDPSGRRVYVANLGSDSISVIDTAAHAVVATVSVAPVARYPAGIVVHPDGSRLYVVAYMLTPSFAGWILVVDTRSLGIVASIAVGYPDAGIAIDASGARVYVSGLYGGSIVDTATNSAIGRLLPGTEAPPVAVAVNPAGSLVYASGAYVGGVPPPGRFNAVTGVDVASGAIVARIPFDQPRGLAVNPSGSRVYVANGASTVSVIDTATRMVVANIAVGMGPVALGQFIAPEALTADIPALSATALVALGLGAMMVGAWALGRRREGA
jgi:YVTN family beta-propeller protein